MNSIIFISNSSKQTKNSFEQIGEYKISNVALPIIKAANKLNYDVILGVNRKYPDQLISSYNIKFYNSNTYRSIFNLYDIYIAYRNLNQAIKKYQPKIIHCNTPIGGLIGRICGKKNKIKTVIYTAHGFHFYNGAPLKNNVIFKTAEKIMARMTDIIITMNKEDYETAKKFKLKKGGKVYFVHGVGINDPKIIKIDKKKYLKNIGLTDDDKIIISMGDLVKRKNYSDAIKAISLLKNTHIHYLICGDGPEKNNLKKIAKKLNVSEQIHFLGFRNDIVELLNISDLFVLSSLQEGLPRSTMEAMSYGLPCVVSRIRGNIDLIKDNINGLTYSVGNIKELSNNIEKLLYDAKKIEKIKINNINAIKNYSYKRVCKEMLNIYKDIGL